MKNRRSQADATRRGSASYTRHQRNLVITAFHQLYKGSPIPADDLIEATGVLGRSIRAIMRWAELSGAIPYLNGHDLRGYYISRSLAEAADSKRRLEKTVAAYQQRIQAKARDIGLIDPTDSFWQQPGLF